MFFAGSLRPDLMDVKSPPFRQPRCRQLPQSLSGHTSRASLTLQLEIYRAESVVTHLSDFGYAQQGG